MMLLPRLIILMRSVAVSRQGSVLAWPGWGVAGAYRREWVWWGVEGFDWFSSSLCVVAGCITGQGGRALRWVFFLVCRMKKKGKKKGGGGDHGGEEKNGKLAGRWGWGDLGLCWVL